MVTIKQKTCAVCKFKFKPRRLTTERVCSIGCAIKFAKKEAEKQKAKAYRQEKRETKKKIENLEPLSYWIKKCQKYCNDYVRARDKGKPCISCGQMEHKGNLHQAGHYFATGGYPELRFNLDNNHGQCTRCNMYLSGNLIPYTENLPERIGVVAFNNLKSLRHKPRKYGKTELKEMITYYKNKTKDYE